MSEILIRKAAIDDLDTIKKLSDLERKSIGFMTRATYREAIQEKNIFVITVDSKVVGFQLYYHRKNDLQTTLYQKTIDPQFRNNGFAKMLVEAVVEEAKSIGHNLILLKCPVDLPSNEFHKKIGFRLLRTDKGKKRELNIWVMNI